MSDETRTERATVAGESRTWKELLRGLAIVALTGAAAIHFAYAPTHFGENTTQGLFFVAVAWLQVAALVALVRWPDRRASWLLAGAVSLGVTAIWVLTRTAGLPGESAEDPGWADGLAAALQAVTLLSALVVLLSARARRPAPRVSPVVAAVAVGLLLAAVSATFSPEVGLSHQHGEGGHGEEDDGHGHEAEHGTEETSTGEDGHDHGDEDHHSDEAGDGTTVPSASAGVDDAPVSTSTPTTVPATTTTTEHDHSGHDH